MFKVKNVKSKVSDPKKNITITGVCVRGGKLVDESGDITAGILNELPDPEQPFDIKITLVLDEDPEEE